MYPLRQTMTYSSKQKIVYRNNLLEFRCPTSSYLIPKYGEPGTYILPKPGNALSAVW